MGKAESRTEKDSFLAERLFGDHHHKTTISDSEESVEARGRTPEEAESRASKKWADKKNNQQLVKADFRNLLVEGMF